MLKTRLVTNYNLLYIVLLLFISLYFSITPYVNDNVKENDNEMFLSLVLLQVLVVQKKNVPAKKGRLLPIRLMPSNVM